MESNQKTFKAAKKNHPGLWRKSIKQEDLFSSPYLYGGMPFKFIDLFSGIGGFRSGLVPIGGECVYSSEWDNKAVETYSEWYQDKNVDSRDIREIDYSEIPDHDILCGGFPCQPFSLAGVSKKTSMGVKHGFDDEKQGNLFYSIMDAVEVKRPSVVFLENVKNLKSHDEGRTWQVIQASLREAGYHVFDLIIDAQGWVPQHRERIFIVCFNKEVFGENSEALSFRFPTLPESRISLTEVLEEDPDKKYMLTDNLWKYLQDYKKKHSEAGHGFGYGIIEHEDRDQAVTRTLSARYHKDGSEVLIREPGWKNPRRLTPKEAMLLQGFNSEIASTFGHKSGFPQIVSDTAAYKQFGNAVVPAVIQAIGEKILSALIIQKYLIS